MMGICQKNEESVKNATRHQAGLTSLRVQMPPSAAAPTYDALNRVTRIDYADGSYRYADAPKPGRFS
jgi:hypothetical protein